MNENKIPKLMTAKEYSKYVQTDVRTVRRWMRKGLLKFTPPPKEHPHYARLIDSSQPRPTKRKKKGAKSTNTAQLKVKSTANVTRQVDKRPANIPRQVDKQPANIPRQVDKRLPKVTSQPQERKIYTRNPAFEKQLQSSNIKRPANIPKQFDKQLANVHRQPSEKIAEQGNGQSAIVLLAIVAFAKPAFDLFQLLCKKMQQQRESSHINRADAYMSSGSLFQPNQEIAYLPKRTLAEIIFGKQSKK